jgi:hypothetical protein
MPGFDPSTATIAPAQFDPTTAQPAAGGGFDPTTARPAQQPGATGFFGQIGQTVGDLWNANVNHQDPNHAPNVLEQGLMGAGQRTGAALDSAVANNILIQPVRTGMEALNVGRQPGESQADFHARYNQAIINMRQHAAQEQQQVDQTSTGIGKVGQAALNIGTDIAANPQYMLIPGMGVGQRIRTRIATAVAGNAAIGGLSDAAAQGMDIASGVKKDFDIQQNLQNSMVAGAFGGAMHSAVEVAPFVKGLFANRGVDTTPAADPRASAITPLTGDHVAMNAADAIQYRQLLQTGSVDDIKNFFQGRNGPQPSYQEANQWVEHRDGPQPISVNGQPGGPNPDFQPTFDYETAYNQHAENQWAEQNRQAVQDHVTNQMAGWSNAPNVEVVHSPADIADPNIRAQALASDTDGRALGFLGADGQVRMFSGRITDPDTASAVLYHEGLGHFGLAEKFGDKLDQTLSSMLDRNVNGLSKATDAWQKANPGEYGGDRLRAAEEVLAERSEAGQMPDSWQNAVSSAVRQFGRKMGLKLAYSDAEVNHILAMAHDAVVNGQPSAAANGFRGATQSTNKFMFTGRNAYGYDPNGLTADLASDGRIRNEIDDSQAKLKDPYWYENEGHKTLGDVLDHPELYKAYPDLKDLPVYAYNKDSRMSGAYGQRSDGSGNYILVNPDRSPEQQLMTLLHESQHAIQHIEEYPDMMKQLNGGGSEAMSRQDYLNNPSEKEARITESRKDLTMQERIDQVPPKFMKRSPQVTEPGYLSDDPERVYQSLSDHFQKSDISWEDTKTEALKYGINPSDIKRLGQVGQGELAARTYRLGTALNLTDDRLRDIESRIGTPEQTVQDQVNYIKALADFNYLAPRFKGQTSEAGRALNIAPRCPRLLRCSGIMVRMV